MQDRSRQRWWMFAAVAGLAVAGAIAAASYLAWSGPRPGSGTTFTVLPAAAPAPAPAAPEPVQAAALRGPAPASCTFDPVVEKSGERDGQFALDAALAIHRSTDPAPFLAVADEMAREGRARDTEVALIAACRVAAQAGAMSAPVADVQTRLAQHYASLGRAAPEGSGRAALMERAEALLGYAVQAYGSALGQQASKTRLAQQRLVSLHQAPPPSATVRTEPAPPADSAARMGAARLSLAERPPATHEDLRGVDADLQRLYAQARSVSRDPAGVQLRHQQALAQRNACGSDEGCLRNWYAQRRRQLFAEF